MQLGLSDAMKRVVGILAVVVAVGCLVWRVKWTWDEYQDYKTELAACDAAIADTQTKIQAQMQDLNDVTSNKQEIMANYHSLGEAGTNLAQLQTDWSRYAYQYSICQEGDKAKYEKAMYDTLVSMRERYVNEVPFGWFAFKGNGLSWRCATNYSFYTDTLRVVWLCQSNDTSDVSGRVANRTYAYATADYVEKDKKFVNVEVYITSYGLEHAIQDDELPPDRQGKDNPLGEFAVLDTGGRLKDSIGDAKADPGQHVSGRDAEGQGEVPDDVGSDFENTPAPAGGTGTVPGNSDIQPDREEGDAPADASGGPEPSGGDDGGDDGDDGGDDGDDGGDDVLF